MFKLIKLFYKIITLYFKNLLINKTLKIKSESPESLFIFVRASYRESWQRREIFTILSITKNLKMPSKLRIETRIAPDFPIELFQTYQKLFEKVLSTESLLTSAEDGAQDLDSESVDLGSCCF